MFGKSELFAKNWMTCSKSHYLLQHFRQFDLLGEFHFFLNCHGIPLGCPFATSPEGTKSPEDYVANLQAALKSREKSKAQQKKDNRQDDEEEEPVMKKPAAKAKSIAKKTEEEKESKEVDSASVKKTATKAKAAAKSAPKASAGKAKPKAAVKSAAAEPPREGASELPNPPVPWNGTFFWLEGKVHRNPAATCWRVFINKSDRNDKKVKFGDDEVASFHKALRLIEDGIALETR
jgi:hypothetical protein